MTGSPDTPWDIEVERLIRERGMRPNEARDAVTWDWLKNGDVRPLAAFLLQSYEPGFLVRRYLGRMLLDEKLAKHLPDRIEDNVPYKLVAVQRSGKRGRPHRRENETRDMLLAENVKRLIPELGYDGAIARVEEAIQQTGGAIGRQTIRDAYDRRYGKKSTD